MFVNSQDLITKLKGTSVPKPLSGTLSGHSAGEPFDKHVYKLIKEQQAENAYRQYEYLNFLYSSNQDAKTLQARQKLIEVPTVLYLISRGKAATERWSLDSLFEEKQDDTADILVVKDKKFEFIDVKTRNTSKKAQAPNIISAKKLAELCAKVIDNKDFATFELNYVQVDWALQGDQLVCQDAFFAKLFLSPPKDLYINWAAAMQIQFHVHELEQTYTGGVENWAREYIEHFMSSAQSRVDYMAKKYIQPFEKYKKQESED